MKPKIPEDLKNQKIENSQFSHILPIFGTYYWKIKFIAKLMVYFLIFGHILSYPVYISKN